MTTTDELMDLIRGELDHANGSVDYTEIATAIAGDLSPEMREHYLLLGLRGVIAQKIAALRPPATHSDDETSNRSARWEQVGEARDLLEDWWVGFQGQPSKPLLDCSPGDLLLAAEWYKRRAEGCAARAEAYTSLANTIRRHGFKTPADLPREQVRKILDA